MKNHLKISFTLAFSILLAAFIITCGGGGGGGGGGPATYYEDADGDGYGNPDVFVTDAPPDGYVTTGGDCDDTDPDIHPGAEETCGDGVDQNCSGPADENCIYYKDADGDGYGNPYNYVMSLEPPAGYITDNNDCDDTDASVNPGVDEVLDDGIDNDCDGLVDEKKYYQDTDGDGYGDPDVYQVDTSQPDGYVTDNTDCDDTDALVNPGEDEVPGDGKDNDCNGLIDELQVPEHYDTIQEAIDAASDGYVVLVNNGAYKENINFSGKAITVRSINGAAATTIYRNALGSVVTFSSGETVLSVLDGFTITNGSGTLIGTDEAYGGGIYCNSTSPTIIN